MFLGSKLKRRVRGRRPASCPTTKGEKEPGSSRGVLLDFSLRDIGGKTVLGGKKI